MRQKIHTLQIILQSTHVKLRYVVMYVTRAICLSRHFTYHKAYSLAYYIL